MKKSVIEEVREFALSSLVDLQLSEESLEDIGDVHNELFNMDYYIIGYYEANQWLKSHNIDVFEGIEWVRQCEEFQFGECYAKIDNSENLVNHIVYFAGMDIIGEVIEDYKQNFLNK